LAIVIALCTTVSCLPKSEPTQVELPSGQTLSVRETRVYLYELTNELAGQVEAVANEIMASAERMETRRSALEFKAATVSSLQRASFQPDTVMALADIWLLVAQLERRIKSEYGESRFGKYAPMVDEALHEMEQTIIDFITARGGEPIESGFYDMIHDYAEANPIRGSINSRPSASGPLAERVRSQKFGAIDAVGTMVEGFADLSDRLSIYGEQLPKQARWQAEILLFDQGLDRTTVEALLADTARLGRGADSLVEFADEVPTLIDDSVSGVMTDLESALKDLDPETIQGRLDAMVSNKMATALAAMSNERAIVMEGVAAERLAATHDIDRLVNEVVDRSFERVDSLLEATIGRMIPWAIALTAAPFLLGVLSGWILRRPSAGS